MTAVKFNDVSKTYSKNRIVTTLLPLVIMIVLMSLNIIEPNFARFIAIVDLGIWSIVILLGAAAIVFGLLHLIKRRFEYNDLR